MKNLSEMKYKVFLKRPVLEEIYKKFGNLPLAKYIKQGWDVLNDKPDKKLLSVIEFFLFNIYGTGIAKKAKSQLEKKSLVSTVSHLGIWGHPIFVNADLIYSLHFKASDLAISLATESVSLNNTTSWSGSILEHQGNILKRYSFFPDRLKTLPVFSVPAISHKETEKLEKKITNGAELLKILKINLFTPNFSVQACQISFNLWQAVFPSAPKLVYLPLESIISHYILEINPDEIIHQIIFTKKGQQLWQKYFSREHTFMFWGIGEKGRRQALKNLPETGNLLKLIKDRKIYPSSPLCFMVLLLCGLSCAGGFTQTTWLTEVKEKFLELLKSLNASPDVILRVQAVPTKNFTESSLASLSIKSEELQPTALDLLNTKKDFYPEFVKRAGKITLGESLEKMMPTIYEVVNKG